MLIDIRPDEPDPGLFTPDEQLLLDRVRASELWQLISTAMKQERDSLLELPVDSTEALHQRWGAIAQLTHWIGSGPLLVVQHDRLRKQERDNHGR